MDEVVSTKLALEARIYFKKKSDEDRYFIEINGVFYHCTQSTASLCDGIPPDEVKEYSEVHQFTYETEKGSAVDAAELHKLAEQQIESLHLRHAKSDNDPNVETQGLASGSSFVKKKSQESTQPQIHALLSVHQEGINKSLKSIHFRLDADKHQLINNKNHKVVFDAEGSTRSDLFSDLDDAALPEYLAQMQIAVVKTLQVLYRESGKVYPKGVTDLFLIQEGITEAEKQKVAENITPRYKEILTAALLASEFDDIRHLITVEQKPIADKKQNAERAEHVDKSVDQNAVQALFCLDFDKTISGGHTHNQMLGQFDWVDFSAASTEDPYLKCWDENRQDCEDFIKAMPPTADAAKWKNVFETLVADGHACTIVSFNAFGKRLIPFYLKEVIGLSDDFIQNHVKIVSYLPSKEEQGDKSKHIAQAKQELKLEGLSDDRVVLIDDSYENIHAATTKGHKTVHVKKNDASHIEAILKLSKEMKSIANKREVSAGNPTMGPSR